MWQQFVDTAVHVVGYQRKRCTAFISQMMWMDLSSPRRSAHLNLWQLSRCLSLRNMTSVTEMGGIIFPPMPGFYHRRQTVADMVGHTVSRVIDLLGLTQTAAPRWNGLKVAAQTDPEAD